ncbi:nicotinate phosphoribosyltransferase [Tilletia horrida]|nr:nicotinate phosphoribosyltransferase [Tilletia horrida]
MAATAGSSGGGGGGGGYGDSSNARPIITSLLDTDLYKLTMLQAVRTHFSHAQATFRFTNRSAASMPFTRAASVLIEHQIRALAYLQLSEDEAAFLRSKCPYFTPDFLSWLQHEFRLRPETQVQVRFVPDAALGSKDGQEWGQLEIETHGTWAETILYEVPLMAIISEVYFQTIDTQWDLTAQSTLAAEKAYRLVSAGCVFSDFGTRRRRSLATHRAVIKGLLAGCRRAQDEGKATGKMLGTSNVLLAKEHGLTPIGTMAHEWFMGVGAALGYPRAAAEEGSGFNTSLRALQLWDQIYSPPPHGSFTPASPAHDLTIALTDTYSTPVFWDELLHGDAPAPAETASAGVQAAKQAGEEIVRRWKGVRQDSGDSKEYARRAVERYRSAGVDPSTKVIIFSDGLDVNKCIDLAAFAKEIGIGAGFGIGTSLTNDFIRTSGSPDPSADANAPVPPERSLPADQRPQKSKALNMVIKLASIDGKPTVKISDELSKNTGVKEEVVAVKKRFGLDGTGVAVAA